SAVVRSAPFGFALGLHILRPLDMAISQVNSQLVNLRATMAVAARRKAEANAASASSSAATRQADSVTFSDTARALSAANQSVASTADVREDKVAAIKAAIADGSYDVDSRALAQSMVKAAAL